MYDSIVIGCGQAGLAIAYYLKKTNKNFLLLDKGNEIGSTWNERYDSLLLFTPRVYSSLPGLPFSGEQQGFPTKNEVVNYLKKYVEKFDFPIHLNEEVINVIKVNGNFQIKTNKDVYMAKNVVVATGPFQTPNIPSFSDNLSTTIYQIHSSQFKNPNQLLKGNVLVVGGGNSGAQIAVELSNEKHTYLAISKKLNYLPLIIRKKSIFWWFDKLGILKVKNNSSFGRMIRKKGDPVFGFELRRAIKNNEVEVKKRVISANNNEVLFNDNTSLEVSNIIWATGFRTEFPWLKIDGVLDEKGKILHRRGISIIEGLYFIGLPWQYRRGSALLQGVGYDAEYIVTKINDNFY